MAMRVENTRFEDVIKLISDRGLEGMGPAMQILWLSNILSVNSVNHFISSG